MSNVFVYLRHITITHKRIKMKLFQEVKKIKDMILSEEGNVSLNNRVLTLEIVKDINSGDYHLYDFSTQVSYKTVNPYRKSKLIKILNLLK